MGSSGAHACIVDLILVVQALSDRGAVPPAALLLLLAGSLLSTRHPRHGVRREIAGRVLVWPEDVALGFGFPSEDDACGYKTGKKSSKRRTAVHIR